MRYAELLKGGRSRTPAPLAGGLRAPRAQADARSPRQRAPCARRPRRDPQNSLPPGSPVRVELELFYFRVADLRLDPGRRSDSTGSYCGMENCLMISQKCYFPHSRTTFPARTQPRSAKSGPSRAARRAQGAANILVIPAQPNRPAPGAFALAAGPSVGRRRWAVRRCVRRRRGLIVRVDD